MSISVCGIVKVFLVRINLTSLVWVAFFRGVRSQNLKEVPQDFTEFFKNNDVTANGVIGETKIAEESWRKTRKFVFHFYEKNTEVGCQKVFNVNKKSLVRRKSIVVIHFVRFEQTLHLVWVLLWQFLKSK